MSWFSKILNAVWSSLKAIWKKISPEVENTFDKFLATFADIALEAVTKVALTSLTGNEKMAVVLKELSEKIKAAGWVAGETAIRTLIESVYAAYKVSNGDKLVAAPGASKDTIDKVGM